MAMNPLRLDPTRTTMERNQFIAAISQRMNALRKAIRQLIVVEDAFGLQADERVRKAAEALVGADATTHTIPLDVVFNTKFQFATDDAKVVAYQEWLKGEIEAGLLKVDPMHANEPWLAPYIQGAYKKGALRAYTDVHKVGGNTMPFVEGGKKAFLEMSFNTPLAQGKLKALSTRAFTQLKGVTAQMDADMTRILAQGLAQGKGAAFIAKELEKNVAGLDKKRARTIARTEIVHAHNEGTLDSFEAMNIHDVGVMAEWSTAHDGLVCPLCAPMEGVVLTIKEARGMLPRHPNCRCAWIPANVGEHKGGTTKRTWAGPEQGLEAPGTLPTGKTTGQTFSKPGIDFGIKESIKAEVPNTPIKVARQKSKWVGADKTITGKVNPGSKKALADKAAKKAETSAALKAAKQQAAEKEAADQAAKKAARAAKKAEKEAEEIALKKAAKDAEIQAVKDKYGLSDKAIEPDGMGDMVLSDDGVAEYLSKFGETELTPQQYKKVFITPPEPGQSPVIAQMDTLAKIVDENVAAKAAAKEAAIEKTAKLKKKFSIGEDGTSDGPDGVPWLNEKGIDDFGSLHGVKYTNMEKDQIIFFTTPKEGQSYLEAQVLKMDSIASEKIKAAQEAAESILTKTDDAKTAFKKWGKETPGDPAALDLADYSGVDGWTPGNKKQSYGFVIFDDQGRVLMREPTGHFGGAHWTFAKGGGTKPATTALAELGEETGHKGLIHDIIPGGFTGTTSKTNYFVGKSGGFDASLMDTETAAVKWMDFDEALKSIALSPDPTVVARDTAVLNAAFDVLKNSDGSLFKSLVKDGTEKLNATKNAAVAAAKSHKIKLGAAQTHYAKPKFGGGVTDADWVNPGTKNKLNMSGLDKVLSEKGWHTSTLPIDTVDALQGADDLVSQKAILDGLKKAPKGTVIPGKAPVVDAVDAALMDGAMVNNPTLIKEIFTKWIDGTGDLTRKEAMTAVGLFKKKHPHLYDMDAITVPLPTPAPAPAPTSFLLPMERDLVKVKDLNGSTRPILAKDTTTGKQWVVKDVSKTNITPDHLRSEMLTDELYRVMNHAVPRGGLLETPSGPMKVTEFLDGGQTLAEWKVGKGSAEIKEMYEQLQKGFVADALLANHDVVGQNFDNIFVVGGKAYRIDNGGGLTFRAQGLAKGTWGPKVQELAGMRDKKLNANTAEVFKGITDAEIHRQIRQIQANRANILAAIPDDSLRTTMAARIDDLVAQLPAQEVRQGVPTGVMRAEYGVTPNTVPRVEKARSNGVNLAVDRDHIEDNNALLWEEFDDKGNPVTVLQFKATKAGSDAIRVKMADELAAATKAAPSTPTTQSFKHPEDTYWDTVLAGYKTVNAHVPIPGSKYNDGKYNPGTLGKLYTVQDEIKAKLKTAKGDTKRMLEHYAKAIEDIDKAKESTAFPDPVFSYVWDPKKKDVIPRNPTRRAMRATRQNQTDLRLVTYKNGVGTRTAGANVVDTRELYTIDAGEDIEVKYFPRYDTWDREAGLALQGTVTVRVPGTGDTAIAKALQMVDTLGVDNNAPTLAYEESLYLHRGINQKRVGNSEYDKIWKDTTLTDEERVIKQKAWIKDNLKIDVDTRPGYDPHGVTKHADGTGFRHWERWDLSKEEIAEAMPDYSLLHTTASLSDSPKGAVGRLLDGILNSGGEFTSTGGRLRKGVALRQTGGASAEEDLNTGGASSFFTRIKKVSATNRGVYFRIGALSRQDTVSYPGDRYGRISALSARTSTIEGYKRYAEGGSNETLFKEGLGLNDIDYIRITDEEERKEVIAIFHKHGIKSLPDGRSVEDVVVTQRQKPKKRRLS